MSRKPECHFNQVWVARASYEISRDMCVEGFRKSSRYSALTMEAASFLAVILRGNLLYKNQYE
jgi:hypothetical protein